MIDLDNAELQNAHQIIQFTRRSLFLTGKAGTGKSTFLRYIAANTKKKHIVLAPTGIAAINAGGSTLHSFFKLPFHPLLPNDSMYSVRNIRNTLKYNSEKIKIIREVELIIIDEISMVRADIIDFIDKVLRVYCLNMRHLSSCCMVDQAVPTTISRCWIKLPRLAIRSLCTTSWAVENRM